MSTDPASHRIGRLLGRGAVASVHEVRDAEGQVFAGKLLHASRDGDHSARARLAQEARLLEGLTHPNIVVVHGIARGVDEAGIEREFVRMELVEGCGLDVLVARDAPMSDARVAGFGRQLAEGLAHAHGHGVVHRDLKPANVLVAEPDGDAPVLKIADFGMARASSLSGLDPGALTVLGTPDYMAPETLEPLAVDARTDLYALGCMLYEMLTGGVPFPAATPFGILRRHREDPLPPLPEQVSMGMRALVESLLAKSPADRPASATIVARWLATVTTDDSLGETSLVPVIADSLGSACASCGQPLVDHVAVCLNCGLPSATLERGKHSVVITGPGEVGDKMDTKLRQQLRRWLEQNPQLGLRGGKWLEDRIPRMPIVFIKRVSQRSANAIVASLAALGFSSEAIEGGGLRHPMVREKARKLAGRVGLIAATSMGGVYSAGVGALVMVLVGAVGVIVGTTVNAARSVTRNTGATPTEIGPELRAAFDQVEALVPALEQARHRHTLRAILRQILGLRTRLGPEQDPTLAHALIHANATVGALARIDSELARADLNLADDQTRALLHQRDRWSGRMLELSGELEALRSRASAARLGSSDADELAALRDKVEALEDVQGLMTARRIG
jgi:hypothetical protein